MDRRRLTNVWIKAHKGPVEGRLEIQDTEVPGLWLRITADGLKKDGSKRDGSKSFAVRYRAAGRQRRFTLGKFPGLTIDGARSKAKRIIGDASRDDVDPQERKLAERRAQTVKELIDSYIKSPAFKNRTPETLREYRRMIKKVILPALGSKKLRDVRRDDIAKLHEKHRVKSPYVGNRVLALVRRIFGLAVDWELIDRNPARGVEFFHEVPRDRFLDPNELRRLGKALRDLELTEVVKVAAVRLLLATGWRKGEVLGLAWAEGQESASGWVDLDRRQITLVKHKTAKRAGRRHFRLDDETVAMLQDLREWTDEDLERSRKRNPGDNSRNADWVFPNPAKTGPLLNIRRFWEKLLDAAEIGSFRVHDIRHTVASLAAEQGGENLFAIEVLLGHTQASTSERYRHHTDTFREDAQARNQARMREATE